LENRQAGTLSIDGGLSNLVKPVGPVHRINIPATSFGFIKAILIRHPEVREDFKGICYGSMDVPLQPGWQNGTHSICGSISALKPISQVWHSGLSRSHEPAISLGRTLGVPLSTDARLQERHYGTWQGVAWSAIPSDELEHAHDMLEKPSTYRPGNGETTDEVCQRVMDWFLEQASCDEASARTIIAVAHSGTITSLCGTLLQLSPLDWGPYYLQPLQYIEITTS
jgi:broad specificity phosphatase PhoE